MSAEDYKLKGNGAAFSECRNYRYALWRIWNADNGLVLFIGLNPSTANERHDDPTIRRVIRFAYDWGYGGVIMANLFAWISADPIALLKCENPIGENDKILTALAGKCNKVIFAWGSFKEAKERAKQIVSIFPDAMALVLNLDGSPRHPLYVPGNIIPKKY